MRAGSVAQMDTEFKPQYYQPPPKKKKEKKGSGVAYSKER
jgi:hypothetical protein